MRHTYMKPICRHCFRPESEHCTFEPFLLPPGCQCDPHTWGNATVKPICTTFTAPEHGIYCTVCEHDEACHLKRD